MSGHSNPVELAFAVAALQNGSNAMNLLSTVPQSLEEEDHVSKAVSHWTSSTTTTTTTTTTTPEQTPKSGSEQEEPKESSSSRASTPDSSLSSSSSSSSQPKEDEEAQEVDKRLARSRERNREHARRTRLRKKAHLEALRSKVKGLEAERQVLKQSIEECGIASILLGLSTGGDNNEGMTNAVEIDTAASAKNDGTWHVAALLSAGKRKRFLSEAMPDKHSSEAQPLTVYIDGEETSIGGGKSHINWKTGMYRAENGSQKQLTAEQLENLRRERNRMHAKMTRDRKKCFIATVEKTIEELEKENNRMKSMLSKLSAAKFSQLVTPAASPSLSASEAPHISEDDEGSVYSQADSEDAERENVERAPKRACHGFRLDG